MKRHVVQVRFPAVADAPPTDLVGLLVQLRAAANKEMPYAYWLDAHQHEYGLVPTRTRNWAGELEDVQPLLDRHVSIPAGSRSVAGRASLMVDQLSEQTGLHVSCCQTSGTGIRGGQERLCSRQMMNPHAKFCVDSFDWRSNKTLRHQTGTRLTIIGGVGCDGTGAPGYFVEVRGIFSGE
jgi:hypothetical protein